MHVAVLIAGIADPKRPMVRPASNNWADIIGAPTTPFRLSPFDEAALEIALKFRDRNPDTVITALVTDGSSDLALMRSVAAYRLDRVIGLCPPPEHRGNPAWIARHAPKALQQSNEPVELILIGREHGDLDDGMTAAYLAECWKWPFVGLALYAQRTDEGQLLFERISTDKDESILLPAPACASISNDKNNRLRHPLMKNVMMAKQQKFPAITPHESDPEAGAVISYCEPAGTSTRGDTSCQILKGSISEQAHILASHLKTRHFFPDSHAN